MSLPSRERGLKSMQKRSNKQPILVAPLAGAWIEIVSMFDTDFSARVAPLAGAWIEIVLIIDFSQTCSSLPSRERGLKYIL